MKSLTTTLLISVSAVALGACTQTYKETEGVTLQAGNAVAYNSALQIIDPWPEGVQDTNLVVPANRGGSGDTTGGGEPAPAEPVVEDD